MRTAAVFVSLCLMLGLLPAAQAAQSTFKVSIWPASFTLSGVDFPGTFATWRTTFWELSYAYAWDDWDLHFQYAWGSESGWTGTFAGTTSGTDRIWGVDVSRRYTFQFAPLGPIIAHALVGYGSLQFSATAPAPSFSFTSSGFRVGWDATMPIPSYPNWSFYTRLLVYPSNQASRFDGASTTTASSSARDLAVSIVYQSAGPSLEFGYRTASFDNGEWSGLATLCPCTSTWSGWYIGASW